MRETSPHVQLLLLPELHLSAPRPLLEEHGLRRARWRSRSPGPLTERLGGIARETGTVARPGLDLRARGRRAIYNTAVAISPDGDLVARYRKVFPWQPHESCAPGDASSPSTSPDVGRVGLVICYDGCFPEIFRQLAWMGAEVVLQPTLTTTSDREQSW